MEDFAQVLVKYPHEKYNSDNYEQIAKNLYQFSGDGLNDVQQLARRLLVNTLLANGDAHLKNWSLLYSDQAPPKLSPAYDIVTTSVYIENE
ncbi:MAG: type II toxin-antitoxin system HipA family toxin [Marinomonas foliarum]